MKRSTCRLCGRSLPRPASTGRPRVYCEASVRPCKEQQHTIDRLERRAATAAPVCAVGLLRRAAQMREAWLAPASG